MVDNSMKKLLLILLLSFFTTVTICAESIPAPKNSLKPIDQVAAIVNDSIITQSQVDKAYKNTIIQMKKAGKNIPDESTLKTAILNQLIAQELQMQLVKQNNITVTNAQVSQAIKNIAKQHKISVTTLKNKVTAQGMSYSEYRKQLKKQIALSIIQHQALSKDIQVSKAEINEFINKIKTQKDFAKKYHIIDVLVPVPAAPTTTQEKQAKVEAMQITKTLKHGADVLTIKGATVKDLGWQPSYQLPDLFLNQLINMKKGDIAGPLRAGNGYHIIKLIGVREGKRALPTPEQVKMILQEQKFQKALKKWLDKLRKDAYVKIVTPQ